MLAGLPKAPSAYNPIINPARARSRQLYIIERMQENGFITAEQADAAKKQELKVRTGGDNTKVHGEYVAETVRQMGRLDIVVNNAGIIRRTPAVQHADDDWDAVINLNLSAGFRMCRAAGAPMPRRGSGKNVTHACLPAVPGGGHLPRGVRGEGRRRGGRPTPSSGA